MLLVHNLIWHLLKHNPSLFPISNYFPFLLNLSKCRILHKIRFNPFTTFVNVLCSSPFLFTAVTIYCGKDDIFIWCFKSIHVSFSLLLVIWLFILCYNKYLSESWTHVRLVNRLLITDIKHNFKWFQSLL